MKICHFSDSHLGAGENHRRRAPSGLTERQEDILASFIDAIDQIIALKPDVCVHAGDLFHQVRPLNSIMAVAARQLHRLATVAGIPTIIITGNHDAPKQPHVGAALDVFSQIENLWVVSGSEPVRCDIKGTSFWALPHSSTKPAADWLAECGPDNTSDFNCLIAHGVVAGMPQFSMADLGEQEIPVAALESYDYTALGHFHNYCQVAPRAWYAGATERLSQAEREAAKGFIEVDLDPFEVRFHPVKTREMVDLQAIAAPGLRGDELAELIRTRLETVDASDKIVRLRLEKVSPETLKTLPADIIAELKEKSFALDLQIEKATDESSPASFGPSTIGRLDQSFAEYLSVADVSGFDPERLLKRAMVYLREED